MKYEEQDDHTDKLVRIFLAFLSMFGLGLFLLIWVVTDNGVGFLTATLLTLAQICSIVVAVIAGLGLYYNLKNNEDANS